MISKRDDMHDPIQNGDRSQRMTFQGQRAEPAHTHWIEAVDQAGTLKQVAIVGEYPLTITLNGTEVVTLMTLASHPEDLVLGYLKNQRLVNRYSDLLEVKADWDRETIHVKARNHNLSDMKERMKRKVVTTGCGEGTVFSCSLDKIYESRLHPFQVRQSEIYRLNRQFSKQNDIYRQVGSVHACALCTRSKVLFYVEDVGRHNAADSIAGKMWKKDMDGGDKLLYTTGRITSEIVIKAAFMGIPFILSRSGITKMGSDIAHDLNMMVVGRAKGKKFLVYNGHSQMVFDAVPVL